MRSAARAPWNQGCSLVLSTICGTLRCSTHESFHGFAGGSCGCQGTSSFATLFVRLWLHYSFSLAQRTRVLLLQYLCNKFTDCARFPKPKSLFQFCISVSAIGDISQEQAATKTAQHGPGLVTTDGSLKALSPGCGVARH